MEHPLVRDKRPMDWWTLPLFAAHLAHALIFARLYPGNLFDTDLVAYFVYFRNWWNNDPSLYGVSYFTHPKPLLVFGIGPLNDVHLAFLCSAVASAVLGVLVYLVARDAFDRTVGLLTSAFMLLDPSKTVLTLKSSADMYIALLLFAAIYLAMHHRSLAASVALLLSALIKPVTLPCALYFIAAEPRSRKAWACALLPGLAIPLTLLANRALLGGAFASERFLAAFAAMRDGFTVGPGDVMHFVVWSQLVKNVFVTTAPLGFAGLTIWIAADRRRLTSPLFLMPILFLLGYVLLSIPSRYMPFFRFYWALEVWFLGFLMYAIFYLGRRLTPRWAELAVCGMMLFFVANDYLVRQARYRSEFAEPFEKGMSFASSSGEMLQMHLNGQPSILTPLAFLPYLSWKLQSGGEHDSLVIAEQAALDQETAPPDWILDVPDIYASQQAREFVQRLIRDGGYQVQLTDGHDALLARPGLRLAQQNAP